MAELPHNALDPAAQELSGVRRRTMGRIIDNEAGNDEEQIDAAATVGEDEGGDIAGDLVSLGRDTPGVEGNNREGREKSQYLNVDEHQFY